MSKTFEQKIKDNFTDAELPCLINTCIAFPACKNKKIIICPEFTKWLKRHNHEVRHQTLNYLFPNLERAFSSDLPQRKQFAYKCQLGQDKGYWTTIEINPLSSDI